MKPSFALNLSHDGIGLLRRNGEAWEPLGEVTLDTPDLSQRLATLRRLAAESAPPAGVTTKVIIPASQVLYTTVAAPGPRPVVRRRQIMQALEGMTPYAVDDLAFDWSGRGDEVQVAIVARETLAEAEAFAQDWGFRPVVFVAAPPPGHFAGEPWFGPTSVADSHMPEGMRISRDQDPVPQSALLALHGLEVPPAPRPPAPQPVAAPAEPPAAEAPTDETEPAAPLTEDAPQTPAVTAPAAEVDAPAQPDVAQDTPETEPPAEATVAQDTPEAEDKDTQSAEDTPAPATPEASAPEPVPAEAAPEPDLAPETETETETEPEPLCDAAATDAAAPAPLELAEAPADFVMPQEAVSDAGETDAEDTEPAAVEAVATATPVAPETGEDTQDTDAAEAPLPETADDAEDEDAAAVENDDAIAASVAAVAGVAQPMHGPLAAVVAKAYPGFRTRRQSGEAPPVYRPLGGAARLHPVATADRNSAAPALRPEGAPTLTPPKRAALVAAMPLASPRKAEAESIAPEEDEDGIAPAPQGLAGLAPQAISARQQTALPDETGLDEKMTVFGARRAHMIGGKPRYLGAMLMGALILFLAIVALWAIFLEDQSAPQGQSALPPASQDQLAASAPTPVPTPVMDDPASTSDAAAPDPEAVADEELPEAQETAPSDEPSTVPLDPVGEATPGSPGDTGTAEAAEADLLPETPATAAEAQPEATETAALSADAPPATAPAAAETAPLGPVAQSQPDTAEDPAAALALGQLTRQAPEPTLEPTRQGVVSPGGYTLISGKPPHMLPARPAAIDKAALAARAAPEPAPQVATTEQPAATETPGVEIKTASAATPRPQDRPTAITDAAEKLARTAPAKTPTATDPAPAAQDSAPLLASGLSPRAATRLAAQRPDARPATLRPETQVAEGDVSDSNGLSISEVAAQEARKEAQARAAAEAAAVAREQSDLAVAVSRRPESRPRSYKDSVNNALALAMAEPAATAAPRQTVTRQTTLPGLQQQVAVPRQQVIASAPAQQQTASATRAALDAPAGPVRALPSSASVAQEATEANAIRLRDMNLIGLYGAAGDRRALVRMGNGRFVKVSVGDALDGGTVTAIGDGQLTYQKSGRQYVLTMLSGT